MPRPRTGTAYPHGDHFDIQITLPDGSRSRPMCQEPGMSEARAKDKALALSRRAALEALPGIVPKATAKNRAAPPGETLTEWSERWCAAREKRGLATVKDDRGRLRKWVLPHFEGKPITEVTRTDLERLVEALDAQVHADACSWRTARNTWCVVSKMFDDACRSKTLALRVLTENPCASVRGPDRGGEKSKAYLFPAEFSALLSCPDVPATWRKLYAVTTYLYLRAAEARALEWSDLDLDHSVAHVHQTEDDDGAIDTTKGKRGRKLSIEAALLPLLRSMRAQAGGVGRVLPHMPVEKHLAPMLRRHLETAGVKRADLFTNDKTRKRLRFHDLRATGITWMAIRGDDPLKIKQRAGHTTFSTTEGYIREGEAVRDAFGDVFPSLPEVLVSLDESPERIGGNGHVYANTKKRLVGEAGFESSRACADPLVSRTFVEVEVEPDTATPTPNLPIPRAAGDSRANHASPRAALLAHLTDGMTAALVAGDLEAARIAHEALGRLLAAPLRAGDGAVSGAVVLDLEAERERRKA